MLLSDVCLSVWRLSVSYIGPMSRTERHRKIKIGTGIGQVTRDSVTTFKVKGLIQSGGFTHRGVNASGSCSGERGNVLGLWNYCYVAVCSAAIGASAPTEGGEGRGISWRPPPTACYYNFKSCIQISPKNWRVALATNLFVTAWFKNIFTSPYACMHTTL